MYLGIEIGGTKLQLGVGSGSGGPLVALQRCDVDPVRGAEGIREQITKLARPMIDQYGIRRVGIGFGGPVDATKGLVVKSFQIDGWDGFPLCDWCQRTLGAMAVMENDSNLAGLGEARFGAGRGAGVVFYSNVGSGIGGALVVDGDLFLGGSGIAVAEIGHLRPGPEGTDPSQTVESIASGWGIASCARAKLRVVSTEDAEPASRLLAPCRGDVEQLTGKIVVDAATVGNVIAVQVLQSAIRAYGWALAQVVTLVSPNIVVVGGGIAQAGESLFFAPLREHVRQYVMPPLRDCYTIRPAALGEEVVIHGALALAARNKDN